jgi:hypothetical protein
MSDNLPVPVPQSIADVTTPPPTIFSNFGPQFAAIEKFGEAIAKSGFAGCTKVEQGVIVAFTCLAEKITPIEFSRTYDIIQGQPTKKAAVMLAEFRQNFGGEFKWINDGEDGKLATIQLKHGERVLAPVSFSIEEAKAQGLLGKDNWKRHLPAMLRARVSTKALRMYVPEIAAGIYDPHELEDSLTPSLGPRRIGAGNPMTAPAPIEEDMMGATISFVEQFEQKRLADGGDISHQDVQDFLSERNQELNENYARKAVNNWEGFTSAVKAFISSRE